MAIYLATEIEHGNNGVYSSGPFADIHEAKASGEAGYVFEVTGNSPVLIPILLRAREIVEPVGGISPMAEPAVEFVAPEVQVVPDPEFVLPLGESSDAS